MPKGVYIRKPFTEEHKIKIGLKSKGRKPSDKANLQRSLKQREEKSHNWKGDEVGYHGLHDWVKRNLGKAFHCEHCEIKSEDYLTKKGLKPKCNPIQWANKSHSYLRELTDWIQLCIPCHIKYDNMSTKTGG